MEAELKSREKIQVKSPKRRPPCGASSNNLFQTSRPPLCGSRECRSGISRSWFISDLDQKGSEIRVADRKGGQGRGQPLSPGLSPPQSPGPLASASPRFCSQWPGCFELLGGETGQGCLSRQISGSELPKGTWSRVGWTREWDRLERGGRPGRQFQPHL